MPTALSISLVFLASSGIVADEPPLPETAIARPILFVVRHQYAADHHNTETMFQTGEINTGKFRGGSALKTIDPRDGKISTLLESPQGVIRDPDVSFDGRRILFSMRRHRDDDYHLYEVNADGSSLRQLTFGRGLSDIDPIYLPDGRILFSSTREPKYCMCNRHVMANLFTMDADGANLQQIGRNTLFEGHPALLPDGRIIYDRWEYVDRNFGDAQGLWTCMPDGTNHAVYFGNHMRSPGVILDPRSVPGTSLVIATFSACHDRPWGAIALIDRQRGLDGRQSIVRTWPAAAIELVDRGNYDTFKQIKLKYEDPYPLSATHFLCARMTGHGEQTGIYLLDAAGGERLLHVESPGCFDPMPLGPRPRPPVIPDRTNLNSTEGHFYVADVYTGFGMDSIHRGQIKRLRVVESPEKRFFSQADWQGSGTQAPGMAWDDFNNKRILGSAPVEEDGSAYFSVPADRFVYFQLLDARGMMVQSMRSGTIVRPGETVGCIGCHEEGRTTVSVPRMPQAIRRPPSRLEPWHGPPRTFNYLAEVQPVFDRACAGCHDFGKAPGEKLILAGDSALIFNRSYYELRGKGYVHALGAGPAAVQRPRSWGSYPSRLTRVMLYGHGEPEIDRQVRERLDRESFDRVVTWIDLNAPYYPEYASAYPKNAFGRSPLDAAELKRLGELTGVNFGDRRAAFSISFTRPDLSPCLAKFSNDDPRRTDALNLLRLGQTRLTQRPNPDLPGFRLVCPTEIGQQGKYDASRTREQAHRQAILEGRRHYDGAD